MLKLDEISVAFALACNDILPIAALHFSAYGAIAGFWVGVRSFQQGTKMLKAKASAKSKKFSKIYPNLNDVLSCDP